MKKYGIFCIDDDNIINTVAKFQINSVANKGVHVVESFDDPLEAMHELKNYARDNIDISFCLVDFQMPKMQGDQFIRTLKQHFPACRCIMLSGNSSASLVSDLVEDNLLEYYISKPWEKLDLLEKINHCLPIPAKLSL
ncbi:MAG: response regulator [Crocinitomicaceae bacterium]|nr:response regulator [Crocinitomicaceae bacterium]